MPSPSENLARRTLWSTLAVLAGGSLAAAQATYDLAAVDELAQQAIAGQNVATPVPGFELLLMHKGRVVFKQAYGSWLPDQVGAADSSSKTISGAILLSAIDNSAAPLTLDTPVGQFIPEFAFGSGFGRSTITLRQCFAHTSGMSGDAHPAVRQPDLTLQQAAAAIGNAPMSSWPGTAFEYGGNSMHVAGAVVELATGLAWNDLFQTRLAIPLGMSATRYVLSSSSNPRIAAGCESNAREFGVFMEMLRRGGVHTTSLGDVRVLSEQSAMQMFTRQTPIGIPIVHSPIDGVSDYGVGVWLDQRAQDGRLESALAAGARGFASWIDFDDELVGVVATDLTSAQNVYPLINQLRDAAQAAARSAVWCLADFDQSGDVTVEDLFGFIDLWFVELGSTGAELGTDADQSGIVDSADLFEFLAAWFGDNGTCP